MCSITVLRIFSFMLHNILMYTVTAQMYNYVLIYGLIWYELFWFIYKNWIYGACYVYSGQLRISQYTPTFYEWFWLIMKIFGANYDLFWLNYANFDQSCTTGFHKDLFTTFISSCTRAYSGK